MRNAMNRLFKLFTLLLFAVAPTTFAGVEEFNAAMGQGDYQSAAQETEALWNAVDKGKLSAVTLAREFAYVNYMAGNLDKAKTFISYLTTGENKLATADDQPDTTNLLASLIEYRTDDSEQQRDKLIQSIKHRLQQDDTDIISIIGAEYLYMRDWARQDWSKVRDSAKYAIELLKRAGPETQYRVRDAEAAIVLPPI